MDNLKNLPSADDVAYRIMNDQVSDYDYTEWASDELQAQAFQARSNR